MGVIFDEFQHHLDLLQTQHADNPQALWDDLLLLSLEREAIVSVAYDDDLLLDRIQHLPVPDDVRRLIRHAVVWVWKDEEMHTTYTRGLLLRDQPWDLKLRALAQNLQGLVGGWTTATTQHRPWAQAPLSRALAATLQRVGALLGKIPDAVEPTLRYTSFRDFCLNTVDAERTAAVAWHLLAQLAPSIPHATPHVAEAFARIALDEDRHAQVFAHFAAALTDDDHLQPHATAHTLAAQVAAVSEYFLPVDLRPTATRAHTLGSHLGAGAPVHIRQGAPGDPGPDALRDLLDALDLPRLVHLRADARGVPVHDLRVAVKPSFMLGYHRRDTSNLTDPELVQALTDALRDLGVQHITLLETPNLYERLYQHRDVHSVARYFNYERPHAWTLLDASQTQEPHAYARGLAQHSIARPWRDAHLRISFGKMRSHPTDLAYLTLANLEGLGARKDDYLFAERLAQREAALMMILTDFPPHLALLDAWDSAADGLVGILGCPDPPAPHRLYASTDALALDLVAARHMGLRDPARSSFLQHALHWFGRFDTTPPVHGPDQPLPDWRHPEHTELDAFLTALASPIYTLASGQGSLFTPPMDPQAFPPRDESSSLRAAREAVRWVVGL